MHLQEQLIAELLANPVPAPPAPLTTDLTETSAPPGLDISLQDLMVGADPLKDQHLSEWLNARERMGFDKMADTKPTGCNKIDPDTIRTLAAKYGEHA